jgi:hypothetical protein
VATDGKISFCAPRACREGAGGTGGAGAGPARARRARRATDARVLRKPRAHRRAAAHARMRARAHRVPRARRSKKTAGPKRVCAPNDVGTVGDFHGTSRALPRVERGDAPLPRAGDVEDVPSCAWVATADPRRRSPPCRSSLPVGGVSRHASRRAEWRRLLSVAYVERWFFILFARREKAGAGTRGALRTRAPATRDARRGHASDAEFDWPREPSRYARSASRNGPRVSQRRLFKSRLFFRAKKQRSRNDARRFVIPPSDSPTLRASRFENTRLIGSTGVG